MQNPLPLFRAAAFAGGLLLLAACNQKTETIESGPKDDMAKQLATAKPVELPPALAASKSYRCKDNSVVFIDWFAGDKMANVKKKKDATDVTVLKSDTPGKGLTADGGWSLDGTGAASTIEISVAGGPKQSCKA